jgi:hypothetical protein
MPTKLDKGKKKQTAPEDCLFLSLSFSYREAV